MRGQEGFAAALEKLAAVPLLVRSFASRSALLGGGGGSCVLGTATVWPSKVVSRFFNFQSRADPLSRRVRCRGGDVIAASLTDCVDGGSVPPRCRSDVV